MYWVILDIVVILLVVVIAFIFIFFKKSGTDDFTELSNGFTRIQKNAFNHIRTEDGSDGVTPPTSNRVDKLSFQTSKYFSVVYTIIKNDNDDYLHTVSGKPLKKTKRKAIIENMLFIMTLLTKQFEKANFGEDVKFGINESELGTLFIEFQLDAEQQRVFEIIVLERSPRVKTPQVQKRQEAPRDEKSQKTPKVEESQKTKAQCPNCKAVYKVDTAKIPDKGAYVRCSKCQARFTIKKSDALPDQSR